MRCWSMFIAVSQFALATASYAQSTGSAANVAAPPVNLTATSQDIIVTARRRNENLQDVPISITAISGPVLAARGVRDALDLQYQTPSLTVTTAGEGSSLQYSIRGQRTNETQLLTDPPVGAYFAEVVEPRTYGLRAQFFDLQNVQVLKGVQGTLFGRNMTGGAVLIEPAHPDASGFHAEGAVQYGNLNLKDISGMLNIPIISDVLAFRVAGKYRDRDGYMKEVNTGRDYDDQHYYTFRPSIELKLPRFTSYTEADYVNEREHGPSFKFLGYSLTDPLNGDPTVIGQQIAASPFFPLAAGAPPQNLVALFNQALAVGPRQLDYGTFGNSVLDGIPGAPFSDVKNWGVTNKTTYTAGLVTFKNIFGYRKVDKNEHIDLDGTPAALVDPRQFSYTKDISEEFQMQGTPFGSRFQLTMGGYFFRESGQDGALTSTFPQITSIGYASNIPALAGYFLSLPASDYIESADSRGLARSYAFYGAGTYTLTDKIKLSGGVRYNDDLRRATVDPYYPNLIIPGLEPGPCAYDGLGAFTRETCAHTRTLKNSAVTWDGTVQYEPTRDLNAYASVRQGYRAGGFSLRAQTDFTFSPFQPEKVREYEIGLKNRWRLGGGTQLSTSAAIYYQNYTNVQKQNTFIIDSQIETLVVNTATQHDFGAEFEANIVMDNGLSVNLFYSYVNNKIIKGSNGSYAMQGVPHHQLGGGITYNHSYEGLGVLSANVNASYRSSVPLDEFDAIAIQKGYALLNGRVGIANIRNSGFGLAVFANNIANKYYLNGVVSLLSNGSIVNGVNPGGGAGISIGNFAEPRTFGIEGSFKF